MFRGRRQDMKALGLISGGLDSSLAVKLVQDQGVIVEGVNFVSPFLNSKKDHTASVAQQLGVSIKSFNLGNEYFEVLRNPKYGYGKNLNPCIDCRIFMFKKAKVIAEKTNAAFLVTGEVLNERPMTQNRETLRITEREAGLEGKILRPLSAKLLPETKAEKQGWVEREKLLDISGRSRKRQIKLAEEFGITEYPTPAGGCLLTFKEFAAKARDLFQHKEKVTQNDIELLKVGRHFRFGKNKIIVGRNEDENEFLKRIKEKTNYFFEVPDCGSPITLLQGPKTQRSLKVAAAITLRYSDKGEDAIVNFGRAELDESVFVSALNPSEIEKLRV